MIELRNNQKSLQIDEDSVVNLCSFILGSIELPNCTLSVSIVDDTEMISLNNRYFGKDNTTDVISFPMEEDISDGMLLGDVVVSAPQALRIAARLDIAPELELSLYIIHGILHLIGMTDETPEPRAGMEKRQNMLLEAAWKSGSTARMLNSR